MSDRKMGLDNLDGETNSQLTRAETLRIRADRARVIEQATYRLTDVFTVISARIEILSESYPEHTKRNWLRYAKN